MGRNDGPGKRKVHLNELKKKVEEKDNDEKTD